MIPLIALAVIASDAFAARPADATYARCLYPYETLLGHCIALGGGEATGWPPAWGVADPLIWRPGLVGLPAVALKPAQRAAIERQIAAQPKTPASVAAALRAAKWATPWLQTRQLFPSNTRTTVHALPGACPSAWFGGYLWAEANDAEIDFAEVDCKGAGGRMRDTFALHWHDAAGVAHTLAPCPTLVRRAWTDFAVERTPARITFLLDGKVACTVVPPPELNVPLSLILWQNERTTTPATKPSITWVTRWTVESL